MTKRNIAILSVAMLLLTLIAIMLLFLLNRAHENFDDDVTVTVNSVTTSVVPVRNLHLYPGVSKEYKINLLCEASGRYDIFLDYEEVFNGGMKHFVNVSVMCEGKEGVIYKGPLTELLHEDENGDENIIITLDGYLDAKDPLEIKIIYEMPASIGNEAQGTSADFNINLSIKKN